MQDTYPTPYYFDFGNNSMYFKNHNLNGSISKHYKKLFGDNIMVLTEQSIYNCVYNEATYDVFGIRKLAGQNNKYIFVFDSKYINRQIFEVILSIIFDRKSNYICI